MERVEREWKAMLKAEDELYLQLLRGQQELGEKKQGSETKRRYRNLHHFGEFDSNSFGLFHLRFGSRPSLHRLPSQSPLPSRPSPPRTRLSIQSTNSPSPASSRLRSSRQFSVPRKHISPNREEPPSRSHLGSIIAKACIVQARPVAGSQRARYRVKQSHLVPASELSINGHSPAHLTTGNDQCKSALDLVIRLPSIR